jgi:hypothetical protein
MKHLTLLCFFLGIIILLTPYVVYRVVKEIYEHK